MTHETESMIREKMMKALGFVQSQGFHPLYIALVGSQNYGLDLYEDTYRSDFDFKCIVLPSLSDIANDVPPVSKVYELEDGQVDVKDLRVFIPILCKMNPQSIEVMSTDYYYCHPEYTHSIHRLRHLLLEMIMERRWLLLCSICGMLREKVRNLSHPFSSAVEKIALYGYDGKQLCHAYRFYLLFDHAKSGSMPLSLSQKDRDLCLKMKLNDLPYDKAKELCARWQNSIESQMNDEGFQGRYKKYVLDDTKNLIQKEKTHILEEHILKEAKRILRERKENEQCLPSTL